jgi:hypothetical protein
MQHRICSILILSITFLIHFNVSSSQDKIGPFELAGPDGNSKIRLQFVGQLKMQYDGLDADRIKGRKSGLYTEARRIRLSLGGSVLKPQVSYKLQLSFAPHSLELMDIYFNYALRPCIQIQYGQFKVPFTRYRMQSFQRLAFVDWSIVTNYFGAERQMGLLFHNGYAKAHNFTYAVGAFTGYNARASHTVGLPAIFGESTPNPSDLSDPASSQRIHPELVGHVSYNSEGMELEVDTDEKAGNLRYAVAGSVTWDNDPVRFHDFKSRGAAELSIKYRGVSFFGVGYIVYVDDIGSCDTEPGMTGWQLQSACRIKPWIETSLRYAFVDMKDIITDYAIEMSMDDSTSSKYNYVRLSEEKELAAGINFYIIGHSLKIQNDYIHRIKNFRDGKIRDNIYRSQLQVAF